MKGTQKRVSNTLSVKEDSTITPDTHHVSELWHLTAEHRWTYFEQTIISFHLDSLFLSLYVSWDYCNKLGSTSIQTSINRP